MGIGMPNAVSVMTRSWNKIEVIVQHCECTKCQGVTHFKMVSGQFYVNFVRFYLNYKEQIG